MKDVAADALAHGHAQVDVQANAGDAHTGIVLVLGDEVCVVVMVVPVVRVAGVGARLRLRLGRAHGYCRRGNGSYAMGRGRPIKGCMPFILEGSRSLCAKDTQLPGYRRARA